VPVTIVGKGQDRPNINNVSVTVNVAQPAAAPAAVGAAAAQALSDNHH
jgi:hypothetical protein